MTYKAKYTLRFDCTPDEEIAGQAIEVCEVLCQFISVDIERRDVHFEVISQVNTDGLTVETGPQPIDESEPHRGIVVPERVTVSTIAKGVSRVFALAWGHAVQLRARGAELRPDSDHDRDVLRSLGETRLLSMIQSRIVIRAPVFSTLSSRTFARLLEREVGLALYNDALSLSQPAAQFREFWRVLEAAFCEDNERLVTLLSDFPPALELGFTASELRELLVLRGRASHAQSSAGLVEYERVNGLVRNKVERVRCLAAQVLLTKKNWGRPESEVERIGRLPSIVRSDGTPVVFGDFASDC